MAYFVTKVSKGAVYVSDGINNYSVGGELLLPNKENEASFVLYSNTVERVGVDERAKVDKRISSEVIRAVISEFHNNGLVIDIE